MTNLDEPDRRPATKACDTCGLPIPAVASKCTHCGSYQKWHKLFGITNGTLSILVALVAVMTAAVPVLTKNFRRSSSFLDFAGVLIDGDQLSAFVSNAGDRPGLVTGATLRLSNMRAGPGAVIEYTAVGEGGGTVVDPGKSVLVRFAPRRPELHGLSEGQRLTGARKCEATFRGQEFNGTELTNLREVECMQALDALAAVQQKAEDPGGKNTPGAASEK